MIDLTVKYSPEVESLLDKYKSMLAEREAQILAEFDLKNRCASTQITPREMRGAFNLDAIRLAILKSMEIIVANACPCFVTAKPERSE